MEITICEKIIDNIMNDNKTDNNILFNMNIWDWSQGVALYGIWKYYKLKQDSRYLDYLINWFDTKLDTPFMRNVNTMAPLLTLCHLYEETKNPKYLDYCIESADWLMTEMPKTEMGGIQHITIDSDNYQQLWADTVFMSVLFMAKIGSLAKNEIYMGEAKKQFILHIRYLADKKTGLWYHGWTFEKKNNYAEALWARGNCWFTIAAAELTELMDMEPWVKSLILDAYTQQVESLANFQADSGLWHTLIDHADAYEEVSGSAGFAYGILKGVRIGILPQDFKKVAKRAADAIVSHIDENGIVGQVSYGTVVKDNLDYYKKVALRPTGYGQNLTLMLLVELLYWKDHNLSLE